MNVLKVAGLLKYLIISLTLPSYFFYLWHFKSIVAIWNMYIRGLFDKSFVTSRQDMFWARMACGLIIFYAFVTLQPVKEALKVPFIYKLVYNLIYQHYTLYSIIAFMFNITVIWVKKTTLIAIIYILFDQYVLNHLNSLGLATKDVKKSARESYREKAIERKQIFVGVDLKKGKPLYLTDEHRKLHVEIVGTTGTGKSESAILPWSYQDIRAGKGVIIIEAKGSVDFCEKLYTLYKNDGCKQRFYFCNLSDPENSNTYNPIIRGSSYELKDRIIGAFDWSEQYYKTRSESTLLSILRAVESAGKKITFQDLYLIFTEPRICNDLYRQVKDEFIKWTLGSRVLGDWDHVQKDCQGLIAKLNLMAQGGVASIMNTYAPDIDLLDVYRNNEIVYFCLPTNLMGETAKAFGRMLLMDLRSTAGYIELGQAERHFFPAFIDEFAEFASPEFVTWLNKSRSTGIAIHIAHQSYGDLKQVNPSFVQQVTDNTNVKMVFRVNDSDTAEAFSKQLGTKTVWKETSQIDRSLLFKRQGDKGSLREVEEFAVHPNIIKGKLPMGHALIFGKHPKSFDKLVQTDYIPDPEVLVPMSFPERRTGSEGVGFNFLKLLLTPTNKNIPAPASKNSDEVFIESKAKVANPDSTGQAGIEMFTEYPDQDIEMHQDLIEYDDQHDAEREHHDHDDDDFKSKFD
jgi:hypothetical protein